MIADLWSLLRLKGSLIAGAVLLAVVAGGYVRGCSDERERGEERIAAANLKAEQEARMADALAAELRMRDAETIEEFDDALTDAIMSAPDGTPDAASIALGCRRLRAAGQDTASIPACAGR